MTVAVDDSTLPVDNSLSSPASEGAAEFRALKAKINNLFLATGIAATYPGLIDTNNFGLNAAISDGSNIILQSGRFKVTRTASQPKDTLGMYSESVLAANVTCPANILSAFYSITHVNTGATFGAIYCLNAQIIQENHNVVGSILGISLFFQNRTSTGIAAPGGIGNNKYNLGAVGLNFESYPRSSAGEYCGWKTGIKFQQYSMDRDLNGGGYCIDMGILQKVITADPRTSFQCKGGIRLASMLSIVFDDAEDVMMYFDPSNNRLCVRYQNTVFFQLDVTTGVGYRNGAAVF